jgi:hypothetical protein
MRRVKIDMNELRQQLELVDIAADTATEEEQVLLDGLGNLLDKILHGEVVCFYKEINGTTE